MEPSSRARTTLPFGRSAQVGVGSPKPWDTTQFAHWTYPTSHASLRYRNHGEMPSHPPGANDLLCWFVSNRAPDHIDAFMTVDAQRVDDERVIRQLTFDGSEVEPNCLDRLGRCPSLTTLILDKSEDADHANDMAIANFVGAHVPLQSLVLDTGGWTAGSMATLMQDLLRRQAPGLKAFDVKIAEANNGPWIDDLKRYLGSASSDLAAIHLHVATTLVYSDKSTEASELLRNMFGNPTLQPRTLTLEFDFPANRESIDRELANLLCNRCGQLESLNLRNASESFDLSLLKGVATLKYLDVSTRGVEARVRSSNAGVVDLIANSGPLVSLVARNRRFDSWLEKSPTLDVLRNAIEGTRLESLDLDGCAFSDDQASQIAEGIHCNGALTQVRLPCLMLNDAQRGVVTAALQRNKTDERLCIAAGAALAVVFEDRLVPREIATKIAGHVLDGLRASEYNTTARVMMAVGQDAHDQAGTVYQDLVQRSEQEHVPSLD